MDSKESSSSTSCWRYWGIKKLNNLIIDFQDLDNRPETIDNLIIRDRNNPQDIYAIDRLRLTDRNRVAMKRGIYD
jgi:hypothetical protein